MRTPSCGPRVHPALVALIVSSAFLPIEILAQGVKARDSVAIAPGVRVPVAHTGASRAIVDSNDVKTAAALTFSELMQARGASVNVMMSGGRLVDGGHFLIRGPSTLLTEGAPMLIVDGMRMAEREDDPGSTSSRLDDIAIDDIAKVEVLRGPSAAALYGAGASSGVIVVTTKHGHSGRLSGRVRATSELRADAGNYEDRYRRPAVGSAYVSCSLLGAAEHTCVPGDLQRWNPLSEAGVFQGGTGASVLLDLAGGTRTQDVRLSTTMRRANGITRGDQLSQLTARLNATQRVGRWAELTGHVAYYGNNTLGSLAGLVISGVPYNSVGATPADSFRRWADYQLSAPTVDGRLYHMTTGADLALRPTDWLTLRIATTRDHVNEAAERRIIFPIGDPRYVSDVLGTLFVQQASSWNTHRAERATAEANVPLPASMRSEVVLIAGSEREWRRREQPKADPLIQQPDMFPSAQSYGYVNDAVFALGRFTFADRFTASAGVRNEKETGAERQYRAYPTGSGSLLLPVRVFGAEPRLRAAYGESAQRYATTAPGWLTEDTGQYPPPAPAQPAERMKELEGGIDVDWGTRGGLAFTAYRRSIGNVRYRAFYPSRGSFDLSSSGVELDAHAAILQRKSVRWDVRTVIATNTNRVTTDDVDAGFGPTVFTGYPLGVVQRRPLTYADTNGDGVISYTEFAARGDPERVGGSSPTLTMALHSALQLGPRVTLTGVVDRSSGAWAQSTYVATLCGPPEDACRAHQDPSASLPDQALGFYNRTSPSPSFEASFTRLREATLRWSVGTRRGIPAGTRVALSGRNLATWTQWPGLDPEISSTTRSAQSHNDQSAVPLPRSFTLGLEFDY